MPETANIHGTDGDNLTVVLPDRTFEDDRRDLIAMRVKYGADTPVGHRCSNLIELIKNYEAEQEPAIRWGLTELIRRHMVELGELARHHQ